MLMVAPRGRTKLVTSLLTPSFSEHCMLTGSVPTEEAEAKANAMACIWPLKNCTGRILAMTRTRPEYTTTMCRIMAM